MSDQHGRSEVEDLRFGGVLRRGRIAANLTQEAEAVAVGVTQSTVSAWESGGAYPTPGNLVRLASLLELDPGDLLRLMVAEIAEAAPVPA